MCQILFDLIIKQLGRPTPGPCSTFKPAGLHKHSVWGRNVQLPTRIHRSIMSGKLKYNFFNFCMKIKLSGWKAVKIM